MLLECRFHSIYMFCRHLVLAFYKRWLKGCVFLFVCICVYCIVCTLISNKQTTFIEDLRHYCRRLTLHALQYTKQNSCNKIRYISACEHSITIFYSARAHSNIKIKHTNKNEGKGLIGTRNGLGMDCKFALRGIMN